MTPLSAVKFAVNSDDQHMIKWTLNMYPHKLDFVYFRATKSHSLGLEVPLRVEIDTIMYPEVE